MIKKFNFLGKSKLTVLAANKWPSLALAYFSLVLLTVALVVASSLRSTSVLPVLLSPAEQEIEIILQSEGSTQAWNFFKEKYSLANPEEAHGLGHFIGRALYQKSGVMAVTICDATQNWSCFHELVKNGLTKEGTSFIKKAGEQCQKESLQIGRCLDALGHGTLYASGYVLKEALLICDELGNGGSAACFNGVFKEYNDRSIQPFQDEMVSSDRAFHNPCDHVESRYQSNCYYEIPYWWVVKLNKDYSLMGELCAQVRDDLVQVNCYRGVGRGVLAGTSYNRDGSAVTKCQLMPDKKSFGYCVLEVVAILKGTHGEKRYATESDVYAIPEPSIEMCQELMEDQKKQCEDLINRVTIGNSS